MRDSKAPQLPSFPASKPVKSGGDPALMPDWKPNFRHCKSPTIASARVGIGRDNAARKEPAIYPEEFIIATLLPALWRRIGVPIAGQMSSGCAGLRAAAPSKITNLFPN